MSDKQKAEALLREMDRRLQLYEALIPEVIERLEHLRSLTDATDELDAIIAELREAIQ